MRTLKQIRDEVLSWMDEADNAETTATNVNAAINRAHELRVTSAPWSFMLYPGEATVAMSSSSRVYGLHSQYHRMLWMWNTTRNCPMREVPFRQVSQLGLSVDGSQTALNYGVSEFSLIGRSPVQIQPSGQIVATSTASETAGLIIAGETTTGYQSETLSFTAESTKTTSASFTGVTKVTKTGTWNGVLTLTEGSKTLVSIGATEYGKSYPQIMLYATPGTENIVYRFYRIPVTLAEDHDVPDIPFPHDGILTFDTLLMMTGYHARVSPVAIAEWKRLQTEYLENLYESEAHSGLFAHPQTIIGDIYER